VASFGSIPIQSEHMLLLHEITEIHHSPGAVFRVPTETHGDVYMCVTRSNYQNGDRAVVEVDAARFLDLWRKPHSSHLDVAIGNPSTWPSDRKFEDANDGFSRGETNPVPLAELDCRMALDESPVFERRLLLFKKQVGVNRVETECIGITNGVTRLIWLLTAGAKSFPVECRTKNAALLQRLAGRPDNDFVTVDALVPEKQWIDSGG
jgi:hypothetical protein